jgi:hypothetical protein
VANVPGLERKKGYLYFIDKEGDVSRIRRAVGHYPGSSGPKQKVAHTKINKLPGFWYYLKGTQVFQHKPCRTVRKSR